MAVRLAGGGGTLEVTSFGELNQVNIGYHLIVIDRPTRFRGYHVNGKLISQRNWRFWLIRAHDQIGIPYGPAIKNTDTGARKFGDTVANNSRDKIGACPVWTPTVASTTQFVDIVLPNTVEIERPGLYWIGIAVDFTAPMQVGEAYYGSWLAGYTRGLRDLMSTEFVAPASIGSFDPANLTALDLDEPVKNQLFKIPAADPSTGAICNTDVGLLTERWFNG